MNAVRELNLVSHNPFFTLIISAETEALCVRKQIKGNVSVAALERRQKSCGIERLVFFDERMCAND
jgi:hypothetical protein